MFLIKYNDSYLTRNMRDLAISLSENCLFESIDHVYDSIHKMMLFNSIREFSGSLQIGSLLHEMKNILREQDILLEKMKVIKINLDQIADTVIDLDREKIRKEVNEHMADDLLSCIYNKDHVLHLIGDDIKAGKNGVYYQYFLEVDNGSQIESEHIVTKFTDKYNIISGRCTEDELMVIKLSDSKALRYYDTLEFRENLLSLHPKANIIQS